ncbi:MAG: hypothetical protein A3F68_04935 [Acidobacteria bacterium RIFCSPLOWO2_12_FULL_54_10]|nr:MAG: hypothetical protein A3F68_04935 [Acidobacteria bacterium RIFCSPLOWO2_12_FULL_54_10]
MNLFIVKKVISGILLLLWCLPAKAQAPKPSQHGTVSQQIAGTKITIEYNRPVARGRELFGSLVRWGRVWNPGADDATNIAISTDVEINGAKLAAGTYSLWAEPQPDRWTIIFSKAHPVFHVPYPAGQEALRVSAIPRKGDHMETLAFYFPAVDGKKSELVLHWGTVVVPLSLTVP